MSPPRYAAPGCRGTDHRSRIVVRAGDAHDEVLAMEQEAVRLRYPELA